MQATPDAAAAAATAEVQAPVAVAPPPPDPAACGHGGEPAADAGGAAVAAAAEASGVPIPPVVDVHDLDWSAIRAAVDPAAVRARMRATVEAMEALLDGAGGPALLFDEHRQGPQDRAIQVAEAEAAAPRWII